MCVYDGCKNWTCFNYEGLKARYCMVHKDKGMINVKNKTCGYDGCRKQPVFNIGGQTKGLYCATHKKEGMIDIKSKTCIHECCRTQPVYNNDGETKALYCATHKKEGMVNVKSKTCIHKGCKTIPVYNNDGETKALYCATHKKEGMVNVKSKICDYDGCIIRPIFNYKGQKNALYCATHKLNEMVDIKNSTCKTHLCSTRTTDKYDGYCLRCYIYTFPDKPVARNYKTKERAVVEFVCERFPEHTWITDKKVNDGCSMRRPDILLDLGYQVLIIEIDENAHQDYDCSCENKRIMELSQDVGHRPIIFIRFNPDSYREGTRKIPSCWEQNMNGICVVKYKEDWEYRLNTLETQIKYWSMLSNTTNKIIETIQLFYDS